MVFCFVQNFFFRTTRELEYLFFLSRKERIFFPEFNVRLYDKNSESNYFFFPPPKSEYFFSNIGNQNIFLEKTTLTLRDQVTFRCDDNDDRLERTKRFTIS